jgi:hypothetical protein
MVFWYFGEDLVSMGFKLNGKKRKEDKKGLKRK